MRLKSAAAAAATRLTPAASTSPRRCACTAIPTWLRLKYMLRCCQAASHDFLLPLGLQGGARSLGQLSEFSSDESVLHCTALHPSTHTCKQRLT